MNIFNKMKEKRAKKAKLKRITKYESYSIGDRAYLGDENIKCRDEYVIEDRTEMEYDLYLLVRSSLTDTLFIFEAIDECLCVKLNTKKMKENKVFFENPSNWKAHTAIKIDLYRDVCSIPN